MCSNTSKKFKYDGSAGTNFSHVGDAMFSISLPPLRILVSAFAEARGSKTIVLVVDRAPGSGVMSKNLPSLGAAFKPM